MKALVCGAGGFIGTHLVDRLKREGFWVRGIDLKYPLFGKTLADDFLIGDLRDPMVACGAVDQHFDEVYQLAADMGGAEFIFTGDNDADILHNSALVNLNMLAASRKANIKRIFMRRRPASTPNTTNSTRTTLRPRKAQPIRQPQTATMAGRSSSVSASTLPISATTAWKFESGDTTTYLAPWVHGTTAEKKCRRRFSGR